MVFDSHSIDSSTLLGALLNREETLASQHLADGANPNTGSIKGYHAIHLAAMYSSPGLLRQVINAGADVNTIDEHLGQTALHMACARYPDNFEIMQTLFDAGADISLQDGNGYTVADHAMMAALNRKHQPDPDDQPAYPIEFNQNHAHFIRAAMEGDSDTLRRKLEYGMPDKIKVLALHETLASWKYDCCQLLLDHHADPDGKGIDGTTPLTVAAFQLETDIAGLLHTYGSDLELGNDWDGQKPLFCACQAGGIDSPVEPEEGRLKMASLLLRRGADVEGADNDGWTPLRQAVFVVKDINLARLLLQHGADPSKPDKSGITPLQLAELRCSREIVELLQKSRHQPMHDERS